MATALRRFLRNPRVWSSVQTWGLRVTFALVSAERTLGSIQSGTVGVDLRIYRAAVQAVVAGESPWSASVGGFSFAGTPPALLAYAPAALLPESLALLIYWALFTAAALATLRKLKLPYWWVLFPPLYEAILVVNADALLVLFLLSAGPWAGVAAVLKTYAAIPLGLQRRWGALAVAVATSALTLPLWIDFLQARESITATLAEQASGGLSAWGSWVAIPAVAGLIALRDRGAAWLVVPALWPYTQLHYAAIALPALRGAPILALLLCFPFPLLPPVAVILEACRVQLLSLRAKRLLAESSQRGGVAAEAD